MHELIDFFAKLLDTSGFPSRWNCGTGWTLFLGWTHILSDIAIWLAYFCIPAMLFYFSAKKKQDILSKKIFVLFGAFIFCCGTIHLVEASIFWHPWYRLSALIKFITAIISIWTAIELAKAIPVFLDLKSPMELQKLLDEHTRDLERSNSDLAQFAYIASHDLQEPLRTVENFIHLLDQHLEKLNLSDPKVKKYNYFITDATARMRQLIEDILAFSKVGKNNVTELIDLNELVDEILHSIKFQIAELNAKVSYGNLPKMTMNPVEMKQLFQNLISNALKFVDKGRTPQISINAELQGNSCWLFSVKDNGIGIDSKYVDKIFAIFQRLHSAVEYKGTGIGLSICKKVVEHYGGEIWVESKLGEGSTFYFTLKDRVQSNL